VSCGRISSHGCPYAGDDGSEAAKAIRRDIPGVKVIGISVDPDMEPLIREAGACAYVQKPDLATGLYPALYMAMEGRAVNQELKDGPYYVSHGPLVHLLNNEFSRNHRFLG
jgi:hypothetical protein